MKRTTEAFEEAAILWEDLGPDGFEVIGFLRDEPGTWTVPEALRLVAKLIEMHGNANEALRPPEDLGSPSKE